MLLYIDDLHHMTAGVWGQMAGGDKEAFLTLYQSHYHALFRYGFSISIDRELTKDCIQELFLEIWNTRHTLNKDVINVQSYLFTWLRRKMSRELSRLAKDKLADELRLELPVMESSYEELLIAFQQSEEKKMQLREALKKLTKKQLEIVRLKFFENLSYRTIATQTSLTPRTIYNLIYEAIRHLRESMKLLLILLFI
ncbi:MAG: sigma-70 family RNA polymerase sigma factor [Bacteroidota bacterium]|nr:sigma-70 family RNA polymerase sigma factor [Bacteroidota bacterium]MDP4254517.1 sigma-70 family RNA polymerase sigma factor [Bacteroidota bacterium]MDP4260676.1 sigma-70 family RNA polymerase sigma factor [Bacteroidota bacterium]